MVVEQRADPPGRLSCRDVVELVTAYLEDVLDAEARHRFEAHLMSCDGCAGYLAQMRQTLQVLGHLREDEIVPDAMEALREAFREWHKS